MNPRNRKQHVPLPEFAEQPPDAHWTPEYRAWIKQQADRQWAIISRKYDAVRNPFVSMSDERRAELEKEWQS